IPYYERRGEPAAFQPLVRAASTALDAVRRGLAREALFRFLCSGAVDVAALAGEPQAPGAWMLHRVAMDARIDRFFGEEARRPAQAWARKLQDYGEELDARKSVRASEAAAAGRALTKIAERMEQLRAPRSLRDFVKDWRAFWTEAGFLAGGRAGGSGEALRRAESSRVLEQALDELSNGPGADEVAGLEAFAVLFETSVAAQSVRVEGLDRAGGVRVLNLYDLRGLRFERLVLAGMDETRFPAAPGPDPVLGLADGRASAVLRAALERLVPDFAPWAGVEPRLPGEVRDEERALLELARNAVEDGGLLLLTRSRTTDGSRPAGASSYWEEPAFRGAPVEAVAPVRPAPALPDCETGEEAELRAAWLLGGGEFVDAAEAALAAASAGAGRLPPLMERTRVERERERYFENIPREREEIEAGGAGGELGAHAGAFDGALATPPSGLRALRQRILDAPLSPSALEKQAQCRFRYLAEYLYEIDVLERPEDDLSPLSRGSLWHEILARFCKERLDESRRAGLAVAMLDPARRVALLGRLEALARDQFERAPERFFTGHPGLWGLQREKLLAGLGVWLEFELEQAAQADAFRPAFVEFAFGAHRLAPAVEVPIETHEGPRVLRLEGRIDRVDLLLADPAASTPVVKGIRLLDYKLGKGDLLKGKLGLDELRSLRQAQLPVYLAAAVGFLKAKEAEGWQVDWDSVRATSEATLYSLRDLPMAVHGKGKASALVKLKEESAGYLRKLVDPAGTPLDLLEAVRRNVGAVLNGRFAVAPWECAGTACAARFACRYRNLPVALNEEGGDA
ncbi:MAG: PD-(D/E)XK nuclease family protein, partial [Planctomycetota bacterium]|nr:PD-(D/E)XK nuclease family protein [Planctomycetota bacterium]